RVHAEGFLDGQLVGGDDGASVGEQNGGAVGKVILPLLVVRLHAAERVEQSRPVEHVAAGVDFRDGGFLGGGVFLFDDFDEAARGIADDAPQSLVVLGDGGADDAGGVVLALPLEKVGQR